MPTWNIVQFLFQNCYFCFLSFDYLAVFIFLSFDQCIEFGIVHKHFFLYFCISYQNFLLEILALRMGVIDQLLHAIHLNKKLGILNFIMSQLQKPLIQRFVQSSQSWSNSINRFAIVIHAHFNIKFLPQQKKMLFNLEHQLFNNSIHVFQHPFPRYIFLHLFGILCIQSPLWMNFSYILKFMVEMLVIQFERTHSFNLLFAILVNTKGHNLLLVIDAPVLFALVH